MKILTLDDQEMVTTALRDSLKGDYEVFEAHSVEEATHVFEEQAIDLAFLDVDLGQESGREGVNALKKFYRLYQDTAFVMLTGQKDDSLIEECLQSGAVDYLRKPCERQNLLLAIQKATVWTQLLRQNRSLKKRVTPQYDFFLETKNEAMKKVFSQAQKLASKNIPVLITGETGTGKEILAQHLWNQRGESTRPFVPVHCGALSENLVESALFGHVKGSFTGAANDKAGFFEAAHGGDIFLDEIGTMPLSLQVKLLRALNTGEVTRVGATKGKVFNFRVISATNESLEEEVQKGNFREDLYFRLKGFELKIPPLRERREDIRDLIDFFLDERGFGHKKCSTEAYKNCEEYNWPGNLRQLARVVSVAAELSDGEEIGWEDVEPQLATTPRQGVTAMEDVQGRYSQIMLETEQAIVKKALEETKTVTEAAKYLGITRFTLKRRLDSWGWESSF